MNLESIDSSQVSALHANAPDVQAVEWNSAMVSGLKHENNRRFQKLNTNFNTYHSCIKRIPAAPQSSSSLRLPKLVLSTLVCSPFSFHPSVASIAV